jgi:hypothetical protein
MTRMGAPRRKAAMFSTLSVTSAGSDAKSPSRVATPA